MSCRLLGLLLGCSLKVVVEEEELILDSICPITPSVTAGARVEVVGNLCIQQLLVQSAVHAIEEILYTTVDCKLQAVGLEQVNEVDNSVVVPVLGALLLCTQQ